MNITATVQGLPAGRARPVSAASRARTWTLLLTLTAIIAGLLGMHVWIGSHDPGHIASLTGVSAASEPGHHHDSAADSMVMTDLGTAGTSTAGCADCGNHEMAAGMCVLALFMVGAAGLIRPGTGVLISAPGLRGPPRIFPAHTVPLHTPSPIQLSISRT